MEIKCAVCGVVDTDPEQICQKCLAVLPGSFVLTPEFNENRPLLWTRVGGNFYTNVRWRVRHHSPTGFEIGFPGSGPADLALNAMAALFPHLGKGKGEKMWDQGYVSRQAWLLHQDFKFTFLVSADRQEGCIEWDAISAWLATQRDDSEEEIREEDE